ncbi:MAG: asparaginase [Acidobacteria bacterium]|nr:asparaginase [Acidobacteriota bacterium]
MEAEILAEVVRGATIESIHRGHLIVVEGNGETVAQIGNPETITFWRSSAKPFQAIPFLLNGGAKRFEFSEKEIALACGSHSGESFHVATAEKMLFKGGFSESDLQCGRQVPFDEKTWKQMIKNDVEPTPLHNNCSGKHAAMLASARHTGADILTYHHLENPVQQKILELISHVSGIAKEQIKIGIDGCALPTFALPIRAMARSFASLVCYPSSFDENLRAASQRVVSAMMDYPEMIGGTDRLDTLIMQAAPHKLISKIGAEGVMTAAVLPNEKWKTGLGIAFKIEDGDDKRARAVVFIELLRQLEIFDAETLRHFSPMQITNRRDEKVGEIVSSFTLTL